MALEKIAYSELPVSNRSNPNTKFADRCVDEFLRLDCDAVKISGWPIRRDVKSLRSSVESAIKRRNMTARVKAHADKESVYMSRVR